MTSRQAPLSEPLADFLKDWRVHLRAKNRSRDTMDSYLTVGRAFCDYLAAAALPTGATAVRREHVERYLADLNDRVSAATTAKHHRSLQQRACSHHRRHCEQFRLIRSFLLSMLAGEIIADIHIVVAIRRGPPRWLRPRPLSRVFAFHGFAASRTQWPRECVLGRYADPSPAG